MIEWLQVNGVALVNVILIDIVLAGDNAIIVGLAASRVAADVRAKVIFWGITGAVVLRVLFAAVATQLLAIVGLMLAGGLLLLWVCWKMYRQISGRGIAHGEDASDKSSARTMSFSSAVLSIIAADVSMSLDNVLAVAGAAKGSTEVLILGLAVAIVLMAVASHLIATMLAKHPWITWIGLLVILWVALDMIYVGAHQVACDAVSSYWCGNDLLSLLRGSLFSR
jgi:YjbE family integral membrane protein